ncbi:zinc finger domain-containing protein [Trebonia kvetii]|uniref:zinc finger domain-containing protein n=1 Tax=Trebonia kvetii TaxID=2480626 RepID=UPI003F6E1154
MRSRGSTEPGTYHLLCPVCGALPGTSCLEGGDELTEIHPSRRMSIAERNRRAADGWEPPELAERYRDRRETDHVRAPLFDPHLGPRVATAMATWRNGRTDKTTVSGC